MCDRPCQRLPSYLHPTGLADHSANFIGQMSSSCTLYILSKRHIRANHSRQKARYSQHWQEPSTSSFFCRSLEGERRAGRGEGPECPPRGVPRQRWPRRVPLPVGPSRFNTPLQGYSPPYPPGNNSTCSAGLRSRDGIQILPRFFLSQKSAGGGSSSRSPAACPGPRIPGADGSRWRSLSSARGRARQHRPSRKTLSAWRLLPKGLRQVKDSHGGTQRAKSNPPPSPLTSSFGRSFFWAASPRFFCLSGE